MERERIVQKPASRIIQQKQNHCACGIVDNRPYSSLSFLSNPTAQRVSEEDEETMQGKFDSSVQRMEDEDEEPLQGKFESPIQRLNEDDEDTVQGKFDKPIQKKNETGMPDNLKAGIESLSGFSMDNVRVHYNSSKPATVQALAYTQGTDIHVAPGQEKHLPHEAWHVAQQMAGRVSPTTSINGMPVNDNAALEHEADVMGEKAVQCKGANFVDNTFESAGCIANAVFQLKPLSPVFYYGEREKRAKYMHDHVNTDFPESGIAAKEYRVKLPYYCTIDELNDAVFNRPDVSRMSGQLSFFPCLFKSYRNDPRHREIVDGFAAHYKTLGDDEKNYLTWMKKKILDSKLDSRSGNDSVYKFLCPQALYYLKEKNIKVVFTDDEVAKPQRVNNLLGPSVSDCERAEILKGGFLSKWQFNEEHTRFFTAYLRNITPGTEDWYSSVMEVFPDGSFGSDNPTVIRGNITGQVSRELYDLNREMTYYDKVMHTILNVLNDNGGWLQFDDIFNYCNQRLNDNECRAWFNVDKLNKLLTKMILEKMTEKKFWRNCYRITQKGIDIVSNWNNPTEMR